MKLVKLFPETADHEDFNSRSIGIFEVKKEDYVIRTYSNGLSFKHIPANILLAIIIVRIAPTITPGISNRLYNIDNLYFTNFIFI